MLLGTGLARAVRVHGAWEVQGCRSRGQGVVARYELLLLLPLVQGRGNLWLHSDDGLWFFSILRGELVGGYGGREWLPVVPVVL